MDFKPKNREWVKNAAIIFLAVMLVLTFFSNTIMNRSLPEVATQAVTEGSITAKVRGTGTVTANGLHQVKAEQTREIRAVMIKSGQEVKAGDVLFILGEGDSEELEAAQEKLRQLQLSYQRTALGVPTFNYAADERKIEAARIERDLAYQDMEKAGVSLDELRKKNPELAAEIEELRRLQGEAKEAVDKAKAANEQARQKALNEYERLRDMDLSGLPVSGGTNNSEPTTTPEPETTTEPTTTPEPTTTAEPTTTSQPATTTEPATSSEPSAVTSPAPNSSEGISTSSAADEFATLEEYKQALEAARLELERLNGTTDPAVQAAENLYKMYTERLEAKELEAGLSSSEYKVKKAAYDAAYEQWLTLTENLKLKKQQDEKTQQLSYLDMQDLSVQIAKAQKEIAELSGGEENQILAKVSGTVQSVECTAGDTATKDQVLCSLEVPDMGYTLSFTVTNEQARRLRIGDSASISNYYWGNEIIATLNSIKTDPKNPMGGKLLTFDLSGDVTTGAELTVSVGQKSANYDVIIPNSSIRSDTNGSFVLKVEAKNSPLGNRYFARRVDIEVLASDDKNSAVTGDLGYGDYVITTGNAPVKNGDMVRLADN